MSKQSSIQDKSSPRPWYREPYVWMLILIPATSVAVSMLMIQAAIRTEDGLVTDDYYKRGLQINLVIARDKAAVTHGLNASLRLDRDKNLLQLQLHANPDYVLPPYLELRMSHTTRAGFDQLIPLAHLGAGVYQAALPTLEPGGWQIQLSGGDWRLLTTLRTPGSALQVLSLHNQGTGG